MKQNAMYHYVYVMHYVVQNTKLSFFVSDINYFHCLRIVELLKDTEKGSKNIFGMYSSQRMKVRKYFHVT